MHAVELFEAHVERHGEYERLVCGDVRLTTVEVREHARRIAGGFRSIGVGPGDRVGVMLPNGAETLLVYEAIWRAGAAITPVLTTLTEDELAHVVAQAQPRAFVVSDGDLTRVKRARQLAGESAMRVVVAGAGAGDAALDDLRAGSAAPIETGAGSDLAAVLFTGGTTGRSKGVALTHDNVVSNAHAVAARLELQPADVCLVALPLSHAFGLSILVTGCTERLRMVVQRRFDPSAFMDAVAAEGVTISDGVPAMLQLLLDHGASRAELSAMRWMSVGGAPCPVDLLERFQRVTGVAVYESYGLTEATAGVASTGPRTPVAPGSVGMPLENVEVRIVGSDGEPVAVGAEGEIVVRSPGVMRGYWRDAEGTAAVLRDAWLHTGDLGRLDRDGCLWVLGRTKELIIRNGFNLHPLDLEHAVRECRGVEDVIVVGLADPVVGERVVMAFVGTAQPEDVAAHCRSRLASHKQPDTVVSVTEIARTGVGKPDRRGMAARLRDRLAARPSG